MACACSVQEEFRRYASRFKSNCRIAVSLNSEILSVPRTTIGVTVKRSLLLTIVLFALLLSSVRAQTPPKLEEPKDSSRSSERSAAKERATAQASVVPRQMGFDLTQYIVFAIDKDEPAGVLNDSDIRPFIPPVALEADWWMVLFVPQNVRLGPPICIYIDKKLGLVRGYIIGPSMRPQETNSAPEKPKP